MIEIEDPIVFEEADFCMSTSHLKNIYYETKLNQKKQQQIANGLLLKYFFNELVQHIKSDCNEPFKFYADFDCKIILNEFPLIDIQQCLEYVVTRIQHERYSFEVTRLVHKAVVECIVIKSNTWRTT